MKKTANRQATKRQFLKAFKAAKGTTDFWIEQEDAHDAGNYFIGITVEDGFTIGDNEQTSEHFWIYPDEGMTRADGWYNAIEGLQTITKK
tara:strand:- start:490 stop:759 length:270 start_codon:yes stop_codon:yes gene_type:complete